MSDMLADMTPGFRDATHGPQQVFRSLLDAMSRPGRVLALPAAALEGIVPPASGRVDDPMGSGMAAVLLTLLDAETTVHLAGSLISTAAESYLRFHTGVTPSALTTGTAFIAVRAAELDATLWEDLDLGTDEAPQRSATLVIEVGGLDATSGLSLLLRGPGIQTIQPLRVEGLVADFWSWRSRAQALLPRGVDLILLRDDAMVAIPRTTRIEPREHREV